MMLGIPGHRLLDRLLSWNLQDPRVGCRNLRYHRRRHDHWRRQVYDLDRRFSWNSWVEDGALRLAQVPAELRLAR
jgi:hypothetical protein